MCTVTWWRNNTSYGVLFNRDESRMRLEGRLPARFEASGISYLSQVSVESETIKFSYGTVSEQCRLNGLTTRALHRVH